MENVTQAIKMAGSVLLFVIALSVAVLAFSQAREAIDAVLKYSDRESLTIQDDDRFYYLAGSGDTKRYVGKETIIPTLYRACKESYKIIFVFPDDYCLYYEDNDEGTKDKISTFDLDNLGIPKDLAEQCLNGILYNRYVYNNSGDVNQTNYERKFGIERQTLKGLYEYLADKEGSYKIAEYLGTYYINDIAEDPSDTTGGSGAPEVNKQEKRVITYIFE